MAVTDRMELKTQKKEAALTVNELLYLIFFGVMLFSKGMGWYDGMRPYQLCLLIGMGCLGLKLILTKYTPWQLLVAAVFGVLGVLSWRCSAEKGMLTCVMMLIGMKDVRIKKVFQVGAVVWSSVFLYRILAFLIGWDKGILLVHKKLGAFIFRWSMGYPHPNVFHISYVILLAFLFYLLQQKGKKLFGWIVAALVGNVLIFIYSVSFTGFLLTGIYLMLVLYFELRSQFKKPEKVLMQCVLPAGLAFSLLAPLIPEGNQFYEVMNKLMNTRLRLSKYFLTQERITLFGQQFHLADKDLNMDNSYVFALMTYGAVVFVLLMIAYFFTIRNLVKENRRKELAITLGFLIAGISEPFLFNTSFKNVSLIFVGSYLLNEANPIRRQNIAWIGICTLGDRSLPKNAPAEKLAENFLLGLKRIGAAAGEKKYLIAALTCACVVIGGTAFGLTAQMPKEYLVPKSICDYSLQEVYYLDEEAAAKERANGSEVLYYMGEETPMFRFSGVTVTVEWMRGMIGAAILTGAAGTLLGTGIAEILEKGRKKSGQYE